ncbi:MAG: hypothetical protein DCC67_18450 [Planctomycetota bacterium]|nr:MAG: hypothetical protein DCC67_18450 [Planctomycetota bacterium]
MTELALTGQGFQGAGRLWTSFASRVELLTPTDEAGAKGEKLVCRVTLPRDAQLGVAAVRVATRDGVSNPQLVLIDDLPTLQEKADNRTPDQAMTIDWPVAVDGACEPAQEDFYRFHVAPGERLSFEAVAERLGSQLDPLLRLLSPSGEELAKSDDADGAGGDSRFTYRFEAPGEYLLALRDVRHAGGPAHRYRLRVGAFPLLSALYPAGGLGGQVASFELANPSTDRKSLVHVTLPPSGPRPRPATLSIPSPDGRGSSWAIVDVGLELESNELEPNDSTADASPATLPAVLNGRIDRADDVDCFRFGASQGDRLRFTVKTHELGSDCDVYCTLMTGDGSQVAVARQERQTDLDYQVAESGEYVLRVENLFLGGRPGGVYRIDAANRHAGFTLHAEQIQYAAPQGGTFVVKVFAQRSGYDGPIELAVEGLEGAALEGHTFEGGETLLKVTVPEQLPVGALQSMSIVGKALAGDSARVVRAVQEQPLNAMFPNAPYLPWQLRDEIAVAIGPPFPPFFELSLASDTVYFPQLVGSSAFDVNISRKNEAFKDPVSLAVEGLPVGITAEVTAIDDGSKAMRVSLQGPPDMAEGDYAIRLIGRGTFQDQKQSAALDGVKLRVVKPLMVAIAAPPAIVTGTQQQAEVSIQRFAADAQPVQLRFIDGPAGLSAPIALTIPSTESRAVFYLSAAPDAPLGKFDNLAVEASTVVNGQPITVEARAAVEIQAPTTD